MKTAIVAKWIVVDGQLEMRWFIENENRLIPIDRYSKSQVKAA
jgi:hypothetical protein